MSRPHPARVWNYWVGGGDYFAADRAAARAAEPRVPAPGRGRAGRAGLPGPRGAVPGRPGADQAVPRHRRGAAGRGEHARDRAADHAGHAGSSTWTTTRPFCGTPRPCWAARTWPARRKGWSATWAPTCATCPRCWPARAHPGSPPADGADHARRPRPHRRPRGGPVDRQPADGRLPARQLPGHRRRRGQQPGGRRPRSSRYNDTAPVPYHLRRPDELASFFDGLDLVEPGVVPCPRWKPDARPPHGPRKRRRPTAGWPGSPDRRRARPGRDAAPRPANYATNRRHRVILRKDSLPTRMIGVCIPQPSASTLGS